MVASALAVPTGSGPSDHHEGTDARTRLDPLGTTVKLGTRQKQIRLASLRMDDTHKSRMLPQLCGNTSQVYGNPIQIHQFHLHGSCLTNHPSHSATTQFYLRVPHLIVSEFLVNSVAATDSERAYRQNTIQPPAANMPYLTLPKLLVLL